MYMHPVSSSATDLGVPRRGRSHRTNVGRLSIGAQILHSNDTGTLSYSKTTLVPVFHCARRRVFKPAPAYNARDRSSSRRGRRIVDALQRQSFDYINHDFNTYVLQRTRKPRRARRKMVKAAEKMAPTDVVGLLNDLFARFDRIVARYGLEKIKTIGDCYIVASGIPNADPEHLKKLMHAALDMLNEVDKVRAPNSATLSI